MKMKSLVLMFIALACGLVASIGISQVMERNKGSGDSSMEMEQILVATVDLNINDKLDAQSVRLEEWPKTKVPEGSTHSLDEVTGMYTNARFYKGEPILKVKIASTQNNPFSTIPEGFRTSTIKVDEDTVMEGIGPGDRVDVMVFLRRNEDVKVTGVYTILANVRVFSKGSQTERVVDQKGNETRARTVSLLVTPDQAQQIALAIQMGKITLALRNPGEDPHKTKDRPVTPITDIISGKTQNGDPNQKVEPTSSPANGFLEALKAAMANRPAPATHATPPVSTQKVPVERPFVMTCLSPKDVKQFEWPDRKAMPVERTLSSADPAAASAALPPGITAGAAPSQDAGKIPEGATAPPGARKTGN